MTRCQRIHQNHTRCEIKDPVPICADLECLDYRSFGKVMFLHLSVSHFVRRGGGVHPLGRHPHRQTSPLGRHPPPGRHPPRADISPGQTPPKTATAADVTHPTGMHSCSIEFS